MSKLDKARATLSDLDAQVAAEARRLQALVALGHQVGDTVDVAARKSVDEINRKLGRKEAEGSPPHLLAWDHPAWEGWTVGSTEGDRGRLRIGAHVDDKTRSSLGVADTVALVGSGRSLLITTRGAEQARAAESLLQSLVARLALAFPEGASFVLLEPAHSGGPLVRMGKSLQDATSATSRDQVRTALESVTSRIERIGTEHLSSARPTFEHLDQREQADLGIQFVVASDVPSRLSDRELESLDVVASDGPEKGTYAIIHWNLDQDLPITVRKQPFASAHRVDLGPRRGRLAGAIPTTVVFDTVGVEAEARLGGIERPSTASRAITWSEVGAVPEAQVWTGDATRGVSTPLAVGGAGDKVIPVTFGVDEDGEPVSHGVVAGQTGKGKSRLLHALICGLAVRYSPEELNLYLIDGKSGLEFEAYRTLPHAKVVSLRTPPDLARSVLAELETEMQRRAALFTDAGVNDLPSYRATSGAQKVARTLCVIDEFQEVFQGDDDEGMRLLSVLTEKGRAFGIHVFLASQGYQPSGMRNAGKFYGNVALRIALPLDRAELEAVDLFGGAPGRQMVLDTCTTGGRVVINDRGGSARNRPGRVALITDDEVTTVVASLRARAGAAAGRPEVFHGSLAPRVTDHPVVTRAAKAPGWPSAGQLTTVARQPSSQGGLGHARWQAGEGPLLVGLGRALDVHTHTSAMLRRGAGENVILVGASEPERIGMLLGATGLMSLVHPPSALKVSVLDRTFPGSEHANILTDSVASLLHGRHEVAVVGATAGGSPLTISDGAEAQARIIDDLADEVERRQGVAEADLVALPSVLFLAHDLDRVDALRRVEDAYGSTESPLGARLSTVLDKGPSLGVHTVASFSYVRAAKDTVGDTGLGRWFRHRVALQMSDDESFELLRSSAAAKLPSAQAEIGLRDAVMAIYMDRQTNAAIRFKPYTTFESTKGEGSVIDDLAEVGRVQALWKEG